MYLLIDNRISNCQVMYIENGWLKWQVPLFCYRVKNLSFTGLSLTSTLN